MTEVEIGGSAEMEWTFQDEHKFVQHPWNREDFLQIRSQKAEQNQLYTNFCAKVKNKMIDACLRIQNSNFFLRTLS